MANEQNLKPFDTLTEKRQREIRSKGGTASQKARKERKTAYEIAKMFMDEKITVNGKVFTRKELMLMNAFKRVNNSIMTKNANDTLSKDELNSLDYVLQMISEAPIPKTQQEVSINAPINIVDDVDKDTKPEGTD